MVERVVIKSLFPKHQWVHIVFLPGTRNYLKAYLVVIPISIFLMVLYLSTNVLFAGPLFTNVSLSSMTHEIP